jgi:hypothetical protein
MLHLENGGQLLKRVGGKIICTVIPLNPNLIRSRTPFEFQDNFSPLK